MPCPLRYIPRPPVWCRDMSSLSSTSLLSISADILLVIIVVFKVTFFDNSSTEVHTAATEVPMYRYHDIVMS